MAVRPACTTYKLEAGLPVSRAVLLVQLSIEKSSGEDMKDQHALYHADPDTAVWQLRGP